MMKFGDFSSNAAPQAQKMDATPFHEVFGDNTPDIAPSPIGRYRLVQALRGKFGDNYRSHPTSLKLLNHFDQQYDLLRRVNSRKSKTN